MNTNSLAVQRSLRIFEEHERLSPSAFARRYFPKDHPGWNRVCKCGPHGSRSGGGLTLWAGGWIGKLRAAGLVTWAYKKTGSLEEYRLTDEGRRAIE